MTKNKEILEKARNFAIVNGLALIPDQITGGRYALCKNIQNNGQIVEKKSMFCLPKELDTLIEGYCFGEQISKESILPSNLYLLYEGDEWLSSSSLVLMGIFTNENELKNGVEKLIRENVQNNYTEDEEKNGTSIEEFIEESVYRLMSDRQLLGNYTSFLIRSVAPNTYGQI